MSTVVSEGQRYTLVRGWLTHPGCQCEVQDETDVTSIATQKKPQKRATTFFYNKITLNSLMRFVTLKSNPLTLSSGGSKGCTPSTAQNFLNSMQFFGKFGMTRVRERPDRGIRRRLHRVFHHQLHARYRQLQMKLAPHPTRNPGSAPAH